MEFHFFVFIDLRDKVDYDNLIALSMQIIQLLEWYGFN